GRIEAVLDWATSLGYRQGENPARWRGHLEFQFAKPSRVAPVERHPALPYAEMPAFMPLIPGSTGGLALRFLILTAARAGEVVGDKWNEIDMAARTCTIAAARMKMAREHRVPLSDAAMTVLEEMAAIRQNEFVFPGAKAGQPMNKDAIGKILRDRMKRGEI